MLKYHKFDEISEYSSTNMLPVERVKHNPHKSNDNIL